MEHVANVRRSSQQLFRPSSCNFARDTSHTPPEDRTPSPVTPLNTSPDMQQPEEEHHETTNGGTSSPSPCVEVSPADLSNIPQEKIHVGIGCNGAREFEPDKAALDKMKEIVHGHYDGPWTSIKFVPDHVKTMWFEEFKKVFCWTVSDVAMKRVFVYQAGKHISQTFSKCRSGGRTPYFVKEEVWQNIGTIRRTNVKMAKQAEVNKQNRTSKRAIERGPYRGGSRKVSKHIKFMEKEKGYKPMYSEAVRKLWSKSDGTGMGPLASSCVAEFDRLVAENQSLEPISRTKETDLWIQACNGPRNGRIFALGEEGIALIRSGMIDNLNGIPSSSTIHTQEYVEPLKDEIREMRDQMKAVQEQNKLMKGMMERLLQLHGGVGTSATQDSNLAP